jgi:hypothetical protein
MNLFYEPDALHGAGEGGVARRTTPAYICYV